MAERSPLFLGLARPPKYLGLPVGYLVVLATGVVLPFIWTKSMVFFLIGLYPTFMNFLASIFFPSMVIYVFLFFGDF